MEILQATVDPKSGWLGEVQYTRGRLEIARGTPYAARPHFEEAQKIWEAQGSDYPPSISVLGDLASLDDTTPLIAGGIVQAQRAVDSAERVYGSEHPELARLLCILAVLQRQKKDYAAAAECLRRAEEIREQKALSATRPRPGRHVGTLCLGVAETGSSAERSRPPSWRPAPRTSAPSTPRKTG